MKLNRADTGYYYFISNGIKVILYLSKELFPEDTSLKKLKYITETFPVKKRLIGLPDLHFKTKNFVPSGMTIPLQNGFSPMLLGPNNDGMGALRFSISGRELREDEIRAVFTTLKERVTMFRHKKDVISKDVLENIFMRGIAEQITNWGFPESDLLKFEDKGCAQEFTHFSDVRSVFPQERPELLPEFVPGHDIIERGRKCIGVLDGSSHFIELFKTDIFTDGAAAKELKLKKNDYYFLVHAGAGDICLISHRAYLDPQEPFLAAESEKGAKAWDALAATANFGFANRLFIYKQIKEILWELIPDLEGVEIFSDIAHDYLEKGADNTFIHRKGATKLLPGRSFKKHWSNTGMPYLFPSAVGGDAYIISNKHGNAMSFNTVSHGAGRILRKDSAVKKFRDADLINDLQNKIMLFRYGVDQIEGQNPKAFKNIAKVMQLIRQFKLAQPVALLKPLASLKA